MRAIAMFAAMLLSTTAAVAAPHGKTPTRAAPKPAAIVADANAPKGKLPDTATPTAYRLDFTVVPENARFSGHDEIDVTLNQPAKSLYMHGRDLNMVRAVAMVGGKAVPAK